MARVAWPGAQRFTARASGGLSLLADSAAELSDLLAVAAITDPVARVAAGNLAAIAPAEQYSGPLVDIAMRPFLLIGDSRFSDGKSFGILYAADNERTGLLESAYHQAIRLRAANAPRGAIALMQAYELNITALLVDARRANDPSIDARIYDADSYAVSQPYGRSVRDAGNAGLLYESVRQPGAECVGLFRGNVVSTVTRLDRWVYYFDGNEISEFGRVA